jgi:hypothetical protein
MKMKYNILILWLMILPQLLMAEISRQEAFEVVKIVVLETDTSNVSIYGSKIMLPSNTEVATMHGSIISPNVSAWMFFIDEDPFQNWGHPAKFVFVGDSGQIVIQPHSYPPSLGNMDVLIKKIIIVPPQSSLQKIRLSQVQAVAQSISAPQNKYAVIISGGYNQDVNYERYWNDCAAIYSSLINVYNYDKSHIYVLMADGTNPAVDRARLNGTFDSSPLDLDGDGTADIQYAATKSNITSVFNTLLTTLTNEDDLFIYTTDHGGRHSGQNSYMYLWGSTIEDYEFAIEVDKVNARSINIVMEQCNSGGFIDDITGNKRVITTACSADEVSYAMPPYYDYDEFVYHWTSAVAGHTPSGSAVNADSNNDGIVSIHEAFIYANTHDTRSETPQYISQPTSFGQLLSLNGSNIISGADVICLSNTTYSLVTGTASSWSVSPTTDFEIVSSTTTSAVVKAKSYKSETSGVLTAIVNGVTVTKSIKTCKIYAAGSPYLCTSPETYTLNSGSASSWSVTPTSLFQILNTSNTAIRIAATSTNGESGTLTAIVNGVNVTRTIQTCIPNLTISGPSIIGATDETYSLSTVVPTVWSVAPTSAFEIVISAYGGALVRAKNYDGVSGTLSATVYGLTFTKAIQTCQTSIYGSSNVCSPSVYSVSASCPNLQVSSWSITGPFTISSNGNSVGVTPITTSSETTGTLTATFSSGVQLSKQLYKCTATTTSSSAYSVYPNPANSTLFISANQFQSENSISFSVSCRVQLVSVQSGVLELNQVVSDFNNSNVNIASVPNGQYVVRLVQGNEVAHTQIITVQH